MEASKKQRAISEYPLGEFFVGCANCGGDFMHQRDVEVYRRDAEDSATGIHAWVRGVDIVTSKSVEGNPSGRRDAVVLSFECEQCGSKTVLEFTQHKGTEHISVSVVKAPWTPE